MPMAAADETQADDTQQSPPGQTDPAAAPKAATKAPPPPPAPPPKAPAKPGEYHVAKPGGVCAVSGWTIAAGEKMMAAVRETPDGLERLDVAPEHWEPFDKTNLLAFWQT